ncbi:MAG: ABC transporter, partial [Solirubrobacteraceae bacterium]
MQSGEPQTAQVLETLRDELRALELGLEVPGATEAQALRGQLVDQIDDYLLPRLRRMDAPLLMVVGGSTGAGKSTLVNSLVGEEVSAAGVLRPTTRAPVLVCHPEDLPAFEDDRVLPGLPRTTGGNAESGLRLVGTERLPRGLALLDAPDIDSVVEANRTLAGQLLAAADCWLFVTTAARYADAVPWDLLHAARDRGTALSLVLDRVAPADASEVAGHLTQMLTERGLDGTPVLVVPESGLEDGRLSEQSLAPVRAWLDGLAADAGARADLVKRTLSGALASLPARVAVVEATVIQQLAAAGELRAVVDDAYAEALAEIDKTVRDGSLLRGEILARWHDVVGTGDLMRSVQTGLGALRDRLRSMVTGAPRAEADLRTAVESGVDAVVHAAADAAAERVSKRWRDDPGGRLLIEREPRLASASSGLPAHTAEQTRAWQGFVFALVEREAGSKRATARLASLGINGAGLTVMIAVFASTGGLTGAEVAVAGGTSALSQKLLEAIFGDQAIRSLAARARDDLLVRVEGVLAEEAARFLQALAPLAPDPE